MNVDQALLSLRWRDHFIRNTWRDEEIPWAAARRLTAQERAAIAGSIGQFQLGESAAGRSLQRRGVEFAEKAGDPHFPGTLARFIAEEQRHSAQLGRFMDIEGIPRLRQHWTDHIFRCLRKLAGLELSVSVLVTAEILAVPYYRALRGATGSPLLRALCERILKDEAGHLRFQASTLARLRLDHRPALERFSVTLHRWFLHGVSLVVWLEHAAVFRAAGYTYPRVLREALGEFRVMQAEARSEAIRLKARLAPGALTAAAPVTDHPSAPDPASPDCRQAPPSGAAFFGPLKDS